MRYKVFDRKRHPVGSPTVTFSRLGRMSFNQAATAVMRKLVVEYVVLMWDADSRRCAIKPVNKLDSRSYALNFAKRDSNAGFSAVTFMNHIGWDYKLKTRQFPATWNEEQGMFEVSLDEAEKSPLRQVTASRNAKKKAVGQKERAADH